ELLRKSWLIAVPSRAEGYGIAVLEAGCCRTPAVANSVPGLSDSVIPE
ncbi:glycosyl transferase family 1, partial [Candidatus Micrarchaeota archaeon CG11_big_fil_rev_8_21_14_0_20_47_5]